MDANTANDAISWIQGLGTAGGLGVFIYLVRLFLDRQNKSDGTLTGQQKQYSQDQKEMRESFTTIVMTLGERFSDELRETRTVFTTQLLAVTDKFAEQHEAQMKINVETVSALNGLRQDVHELKEKVK